MAELHMITALRDKRAELAGQIEEAERFLASLKRQLAHIDGSLLVFDPDYEVSGIRAKKLVEQHRIFEHGEVTRMVFDALRGAKDTLRAPELVDAVIRAKGLPNDKAMRPSVEKRVYRTLQRQEGKAMQKVAFGPKNVGWEIASQT